MEAREGASDTQPAFRIVREGGRIFATLTIGESKVRERVPLQVEKWDDEKRVSYCWQVLERLLKKLEKRQLNAK